MPYYLEVYIIHPRSNFVNPRCDEKMSLGENIGVRRKILGLTYRSLAPLVGVSHTAIQKYEKGILVPNSQTLIKLSQALQVPVATLVRPDTQRISLDNFSFRSKKMTAKNQMQITAETKDWLERYLLIEKLSDNALAFEYPEGFPRHIRSPDEIEQVAKDLRLLWNLGMDPIENLTYLLEDKGIKIGIINGITKFDALYTDYCGHPIVVVKKGISRVRQRFSLAHELGHCMLSVEDGVDEEQVMNRFAGAFLVPDEIVRFEFKKPVHQVSIKELMILKGKYGLSMGAWLYRLKDLGIISEELFVRNRKIFSLRGWTRKEPGDDINGEIPVHMEVLVLRSHAEGLISTSKAAELLQQNVTDFCSMNGLSDGGHPAVLCD